MRPCELELIVHREPFQPYRLFTVDGEGATVTQARKSNVSGPALALHGVTRRPQGAWRQGLRITYANIVRAESFGLAWH